MCGRERLKVQPRCVPLYVAGLCDPIVARQIWSRLVGQTIKGILELDEGKTVDRLLGKLVVV